jgi:hypothetical protein
VTPAPCSTTASWSVNSRSKDADCFANCSRTTWTWRADADSTRSSIGIISDGSRRIRGSPSTLPARLGEDPHIVVGPRPGSTPGSPLLRVFPPQTLLAQLVSDQAGDRIDVPYVHQASGLRIFAATGSVLGNRGPPPARSRADLRGEPDVTVGDLEACGQAFDVSLPRARKGLAEVVDVSWGSGEANNPRLDRCPSTQSYTVIPDRGVAARWEAMISAAPQKNVPDETSIRP